MREVCELGKTYDVLVAGAGPVGSYTAYKLAEYGHSVAVFERNSTIGEDVCCTGIIGNFHSGFLLDHGLNSQFFNSVVLRTLFNVQDLFDNPTFRF